MYIITRHDLEYLFASEFLIIRIRGKTAPEREKGHSLGESLEAVYLAKASEEIVGQCERHSFLYIAVSCCNGLP